MHAAPTAAQIRKIAGRLGVVLDEAEAAVYQSNLAEMLSSFDSLLQAPTAERRPPLVFAQRKPGYRPGRDEDRFCAWLWKCHIAGADSGLLAGKTVSYKDNVAVAGMPLTFGSVLFEGFIPDFDATIVTRVLEAGGTVTGKNALSGFTGDFAVPINPHNSRHSAGGSSSGSAVALAAGEVDVSFGGDQGGSIRIPAAYCGVLGLKPTFGLVSHLGATYIMDESVDHTGPMARHTDDLARALQAVAGVDGFDVRQGRDIPVAVDVMSHLRDGVAGLRIAVLDEGFEDAQPEVVAGVLDAVELLVKEGATAQHVSIREHNLIGPVATALSVEGSRAIFDTTMFGSGTKSFYPASLIVAFQRAWETNAKQFQPHIIARNIGAELAKQNFHGAVYAKMQNAREGFARAYDEVLDEFDVIAMPTCKRTAPLIEPIPLDPVEALEWKLEQRKSGYSANTIQFNYTGHPAIAIPAGKTSGLPFSLQLVGRRLEDGTLLRAAYAFEHLVDWRELLSIGE